MNAEQGVLGPYASVPARYVIGLDTTGEACHDWQTCPLCIPVHCFALQRVLIPSSLCTGSTQDAAQDTGDRVFMTNKAGTKYDCRLPSSIPQTSTSDLSQVSKTAAFNSMLSKFHHAMAGRNLM